MDYRLSVPPDLPRKDKDLPGYWAILFVRAVVQHFAGTRLLLARFVIRSSTEKPTSSSRKTERSTSGMIIVFEATYPRPTRSRAYASPIALPRPSPGSLPARAGSPLAGRDLHPLDDKRNFKEKSHILLSQSTSRAWSHYNSYSQCLMSAAVPGPNTWGFLQVERDLLSILCAASPPADDLAQFLRSLLHFRFPADVDRFALGSHNLVPVEHRVEPLDQQLPAL
jgi:hypothetical protein